MIIFAIFALILFVAALRGRLVDVMASMVAGGIMGCGCLVFVLIFIAISIATIPIFAGLFQMLLDAL